VADNITHLPRPRAVRPVPELLGLYVYAGRNDHKELLNLLSAGDLRSFGVVIHAVHVNRHRELREQVVDHGLDAVLDPATQAAATVGGYTEALGKLPWSLDRPHRVSDFEGRAGRERVARLGDVAVEHGFTQVLAPTSLTGCGRPLVRAGYRDHRVAESLFGSERWGGDPADLSSCRSAQHLPKWCAATGSSGTGGIEAQQSIKTRE
jgi:hypothetical protein